MVAPNISRRLMHVTVGVYVTVDSDGGVSITE